jgi:hypothetical protein
MEREEAELEAARRNASDERRSRLEFYAFDPSAGLANDAWEVTMRLRRDRSGEGAVAAPPAPEAGPAAIEPDDYAPAAQLDVYPEPSYVPEPPDTERHEAAPSRPVDDWFEPGPTPAPEPPAPELLPEPELEPEPAPRRRERRPRRIGRVRRGAARVGARLRERRDRRRRAREELGLAPPTVLERLSSVVGTALITVAVMWIGLIVAIAVLLGSTSLTGLGLSVGGVAVGVLAAGLGVLIRRA